MSEHLRDDFQRYSSPEKKRGAAVTQIMESPPWYACSRDQLREGIARHILRTQKVAYHVTEDKIAINPHIRHSETLSYLARPMSPQRLDG